MVTRRRDRERRTICTRTQLAASECPRAAIYGFARATSPLLDGNLKGPIYLTSSDNELPDLLTNSQNLCQRKRFAFLNLKAQNSR